MVPENNIPIENIQKKDFKIGDLLLKANLITETQLQLAFNIHSRKSSQHNVTISTTLVKLGYTKKETLNKAMEECFYRKGEIGDHLEKKSLVSDEQLAKAREAKKKTGKMLGEQLIDLGYISEGLFYNLLKKEINFSELTNYLIEKKIIDEEQLKKAEWVNRVGFRLGETLVSEGFISDEQLKNVLSLQYNLPFKRLYKHIIVENDKKNLSSIISKELSQSYNIVPYMIARDRVDVALSDINFLLELKNHEKISGYHFYGCLVLDKDFQSLHQDLYSNISAQDYADHIIKNIAKDDNKHLLQEGNIAENYPSQLIQSHVRFIQSYFVALKKVGFSEEQALKVVGEEAGIKYPGKPAGKKRTANIAEFFSIIIADPANEEDAINRLFQNYIKAKISSGENTNGMRKEVFEEFIIQNIKKIKEIKKCETTKCSIVIKNDATKILLIEN